MGGLHLQCRLDALRHLVSERREEDLGKLAAVPRYQYLPLFLQDPAQQSFHAALLRTIDQLGRAMQLGQHRQLIDSFNSTLGQDTLSAMTTIALLDPEVCAAFAVYLTTLEQAYHWPRDTTVLTPNLLEDHKLVIQMLNQPPLRLLLWDILCPESCDLSQDQLAPGTIARIALVLARSLLKQTRINIDKGETVSREIQDNVNLLHRTCRSDWNDQGDYRDPHSHKEFGRLHEVMRASGTQRRMQELFQDSEGTLCLQAMPSLLENLPTTTDMLCDAISQIQLAIAVVRDELFAVSVDEVIWARAFANFAKPVGLCDISAGGGDAPFFWMIDSLCGQSAPETKASLVQELNFRSRFFPSNIRSLMDRLRGLPSLRSSCTSPTAPKKLKQAFKALERQRFELYDIHRKKAARITVSLRAGQLGTSAGAGGCPYAAPEQAISDTLSSSLQARFGLDTDSLLIDAWAQAHSVMFDEDNNVYSARVRFDFSTPLAIGPGDCLLVTVQDRAANWHTRTYSITYTNAVERTEGGTSHHLASAAEVYVRSKGLVSTSLCNQATPCHVRLAVRPAPHFRLASNTQEKETTVFVAQGGALGIFVAWLEAHENLIGKYTLIVASRQFSHLGFKAELIRLANHLNNQLRVVVVLSRPGKNDLSFLESVGIDCRRGRIDQHLESICPGTARAIYVCGTSDFGLTVSRSPSFSTKEIQPTNRLDPIITSHLPALRLHVAPTSMETRPLRIISAAELAHHNLPSNLWIAVGKNVYDITDLAKFHPGGEKILMARAGRQAEDLFNSVHGDSIDIRSLLHGMLIGQLLPSKTDGVEHWLDKIVEIQNDVTNHSRFEHLADDPTQDLAAIPPTQVIYASVECFAKAWCLLLQETGLPKTAQCQIMRAWFELRERLIAHQAETYNKHFEDVERCRQTVRQVFNHLRVTSAQIHRALDTLKAQLTMCVSSGLDIEDKCFQLCTDDVTHAINQDMTNRE